MKRQRLKKIFLIGLPLFILVCYLVFVFLRIGEAEQDAKATGLEIVMTNPQFHFVNKKEIRELTNITIGKIQGLQHDSINKNKLERKIRSNPFVEDVQVFRTASQAYRIAITQRSPVLRIWTATESYYLDKDGYRMPTGTKYAALVHVYQGNISETFAKEKLLPFQHYLDINPFWLEMIDYVQVNSKEELILYLRAKSGKVYLGKAENIDEKLEKLLVFINKMGKYTGMDSYKSIDLRFDNQVVVKK